MAVRKAVVLAAGLGTRLRPLTLTRPKPLLPIQGEPMLARILDMLVSWGVTDIKVNAHYLADQIKSFVTDYAAGGTVRVEVAEEPEILGTGGVLRPLKAWLGEDPFWLVNGDIVIEELDPEPLEAAFAESGNFAACWMSETDGPRTIEADPEGRVCNWKSDDAGVPGTFTYCGVALLSPKVADYLPDSNFCSIVQAYEKAMMTDAKFVFGVCEAEARWCDAGTLSVFAQLNEGEMPAAAWNEPRLDALCKAMVENPAETPCVYLGARGSDRVFWRLTTTAPSIAILYESERAANANERYVPAARFLAAHGVRVPKVLADLSELRALALEDLGDESLEARANVAGTDLIRLYMPVLEELSRFRAAGEAADVPPLEPSFDQDLYRWELDLFDQQLLKTRYLIERMPDDVYADYEVIAETLLKGPQSLVHRDLQSSNVLFDTDGNPAFIDFQGMRRGSAWYDVASLLFDPYVPLDATDRKLLGEKAGLQMSDLAVAACQRLSQALGAYGRLAAAGQCRFVKYIPRALALLHEAAHSAGRSALASFTHDLLARERRFTEAVGGEATHHHSCESEH